MTLIGSTLSQYKITAMLGAGGMGEVYRAEDTKLGREVAVKVLPAELTADAERLARFEREARVLASLDHPGIAAIYSFEAAEVAAGGETVLLHFLVMQLAEGETLAERLVGAPIPVERATGIALQISRALESAHEKGVVHRDLKPGNVMIDAEDNVKVLDFGLAKALEPEPGPEPQNVSTSPTLTAEVTRAGTLLGTAAYMSPEQARGQSADRRCDIWAFGCVLYETLTGRRAFDGATSSDCLARVLEREPEWERLPATTPTSVRLLLRRCLAKDPKQRIHDMADVRLELEGLSERDEPMQSARDSTPLWRQAVPWAVAALGVGFALWSLGRLDDGSRPESLVRFAIETPRLALHHFVASPQISISPDGSILAYIAGSERRGQLFLRRMDTSDAVALEGAERVSQPFFSPDSRWVAFHDGRGLRRIPVEGGKSWEICEIREILGATWGPDGTIVYGDPLTWGLWRVRWDGGEPVRLTTVDREGGEYAHDNPQFLPGGSTVLFNVVDSAGIGTEVARVDLATGEITQLMKGYGGDAVSYLASGHLAYGRDGSLMVVPFDVEHGEVTGRPVAVLNDLLMGFPLSNSRAQFAVAENGTLVYVSGPFVAAASRLVRVDRAGAAVPVGQAHERFFGPRFSPDGGRIAVAAQVGEEPMQLWVQDLRRETFTRLILEGEGWWPLWTPDGDRIVFPIRPDASVPPDLAWIEADGSGRPERLTETDLGHQPTSWTADGKTLIFHQNDHPETGWDVMAMEPGEDSEPRVLLAGRFHEMLANVSPDGRWLAYASDESGRFEVYVRSYPDLERKWQISTDGGIEPAWSPDGRELFYRDEDGRRMMAVPIDRGPDFTAGRPQLLFEGNFAPSPWFGRNFDVAPDGESFVLVEPVLTDEIDLELLVVLNWFEEFAQADLSERGR